MKRDKRRTKNPIVKPQPPAEPPPPHRGEDSGRFDQSEMPHRGEAS